MEYLDIRTENGELTGEIKERTQVHTDGDIHGTSHVWLVRYTDKNKQKFDILLQKRAATKDAYAGCYDISSAGHIPAGQDYLESAVRELEEHYGVRLFDRIGRRLYLTQAGKEFLRYTDRILALCDELETGARQWGDRSPLHIGSSMTIGTKLLPALVQDFRRRYPSVKVTVEIQNSGVIEEKLLENAMDFALIESAPHSGKLACRRFSGDRMVAVCSPKDPLAKEQGVTLAQLMTKPLLLREKGSGTRDLFDSVARSHNLTAEPMWESVNTQALIEAVAMGLGVSVLPWRLVQDSVGRGLLQVVPVQDAVFRRDFNILYHPDKYQTKPARDFLALCQEAGDDLEE